MDKELQYTIGIDEKGSLVYVNDAVKGKIYFCPQCKTELILKKSGKTGRGSKRPHFAHNELTHNCTPESVLHFLFKRGVVDLLNKYLIEKKELIINWKCFDCSKINQGNVLAKVATIKEEYNLTVCKPDIALLNEEGNVIFAIEIVVTHYPEEQVLRYYKDNNIILIQINLSNDEELNSIFRLVTNPNIVDYCINPRCSNYNKHTTKRQIFSYVDICGLCYHKIEKFNIIINSALGKKISYDFTEGEINFVKSKRNNIEILVNDSTKERFPISTCLNCKAWRSRRHKRF